jgi:N-acetylneuraminic acid mutarotase
MRPRSTWLAIGLFALAACAEDNTPTQPQTPADPAPVAPQFVWASNSWTTRAKMPTGQWAASAAGLSNSSGQATLYVVGGYLPCCGQVTPTVRAYDYVANSWTTKAPMPIGLAHSNGIGVIGGKLYLAGGWREGANDTPTLHPYLFVYNPQTNAWTRKADLPHKTSSGVAGVIGGKLYVLPGICSGCSGSNRTRQFYRYDPATNTWTSLRQAPHQHYQGVGGAINGKFYVAGGTDSITTSRHLDVYNPVTNTWATKAPMHTVRIFAAGAVLNNKLYVVGGRGATELSTVEAYDPVSITWTTKAPLPTAREQHAVGTVTINGGSKLLAVGGLFELDVNEAFKP